MPILARGVSHRLLMLEAIKDPCSSAQPSFPNTTTPDCSITSESPIETVYERYCVLRPTINSRRNPHYVDQIGARIHSLNICRPILLTRYFLSLDHDPSGRTFWTFEARSGLISIPMPISNTGSSNRTPSSDHNLVASMGF